MQKSIYVMLAFYALSYDERRKLIIRTREAIALNEPIDELMEFAHLKDVQFANSNRFSRFCERSEGKYMLLREKRHVFGKQNKLAKRLENGKTARIARLLSYHIGW